MKFEMILKCLHAVSILYVKGLFDQSLPFKIVFMLNSVQYSKCHGECMMYLNGFLVSFMMYLNRLLVSFMMFLNGLLVEFMMYLNAPSVV